MLLPTSLTNRRKFLERTALGAGSVLFLPGLLTSCADHRIPDPSTPGTPGVTPPVIVGDDSFDWNDEAKTTVVAALNLIPEVGGILSGLVSIFWGGTDVWSQVKDQVEALINQKLDEGEVSTAQGQLNGLNNVLTTYKQEIKDGATGQKMYANWTPTIDLLNDTIAQFAKTGYETILLPFYAQIGNMRLATQRDVVIAGKSWNRSESEQATDIENLKKYISEQIEHVQTVYANHIVDIVSGVGGDTNQNLFEAEPFKSANRYTRETTLTVLDYEQLWPYFDITKYPVGVKTSLPRELYSDPIGSNGQLSGPIRLPKSPPTQGPTQLTVWGSVDGIDAVQLTYPAGSGPDGVTTTPRMGRQDGYGIGSPGTTDQPYGSTISISPLNPITRAF
jgi:hypothetical protein